MSEYIGRLTRAGAALTVALGLLLSLATALAKAQSPGYSAVITELHQRLGNVEVRRAGTSEWRAAAPLLALYPGDTIRVTQDASIVVVLVLAKPSGTITIDAAASPFTVPPLPPPEGALQRGVALLRRSLSALVSIRQDLSLLRLGTRGERKFPVIVSPRNGPVLPGRLEIEWLGPPEARYGIKILTLSGSSLHSRSLEGLVFVYPSDGPPLTFGVRYRIQVRTGNLPPDEAWFEISEPALVETLRRDMAELKEALGLQTPRTTLALVSASYLADRGLLHDARRTIVAAVEVDSDEPSLYMLLGSVYQRLGLAEEAVQSFEKAASLAKRAGR